jgi:hypothetical protein
VPRTVPGTRHVGQDAWEEIDFRPHTLVNKLANYGWRIFEGKARFAAGSPAGAGDLVSPVSVYSHEEGCSVTGGYVYRGQTDPAAVGRYYFGDWCTGTIWSLRMHNSSAADLRKEAAKVGQLSSFGEDAAGSIYISSGSGRIYQLVR